MRFRRILFLCFLSGVGATCGAQQLHLQTKLQAPISMSYVTTCGSEMGLIGIGKDGGLYRWASFTGNAERLSTEAKVVQIACSPDGKWIAAGMSNGVLAVINDKGGVSNQQPATIKRFAIKHDLGTMSFSPDATLLTVATNGSPTQLWDIRTGERIATGKTTLGASAATAFSPDGKSYVSADEDTIIRVYSSSGKPLYSAEADLLEPFAVAYTPDGKEFAVSGAGGTVSLFDASSGKKLRTSENRGNPIFNMMISPDGREIAALEMDDFKLEPVRISVWNIGENRWEPNTIDPKDMIGAGTDKNHLIFLKTEGPNEISVWSLE